MKVILKYFPLSFFLLCLVLNSCTADDNSKLEADQSLLKSVPTNLSVGVLHNQGLTFIYDNYLSNITQQTSLSEFNNNIMIQSESFISEYSDEEEITWSLDLLSDGYNSHELNESPDLSSLSPELREEIENLLNIVEANVNDTNFDAGNEIFNISRDLINNVPQHLNAEDQEAYIRAVDVMGYSAVYWYDNLQDWESKINTASGTVVTGRGCGWLCRLWRTIRPIVGADLAGAATGFVSGFIRTGQWAGAGVGALAGGLGASAGAVVKEVW